MNKNLKAVIAYEGTRYLGWQNNGEGLSIEAELEKALSQILQHPVKLQAASRTDAGVHAEGQVVNFFTESDIPLEKLLKGMNSLLPADIAALQLTEVDASFHPTLDAKGKEYHYSICNTATQLPFNRLTSWHFPYPLDLEKMERAAAHLVGTHDFAAFTNEKLDDNIRQIFSIDIDPSVKIRVAGNKFLYKMVRNIVGTLVYVGCGKIGVDELPRILESRDRTRAGVTAPAHGLTLKVVHYE